MTLDARLQAAAEAALAEARHAKPDTLREDPEDPVRGAVVAMDPWTGEILVCASAPVFDPNEFKAGHSPALLFNRIFFLASF